MWNVEARTIADANEEIPIIHMVFQRDKHSDQRRYNAPNANEIAMMFVNSNREPPFEPDIRIYPLTLYSLEQ